MTLGSGTEIDLFDLLIRQGGPIVIRMICALVFIFVLFRLGLRAWVEIGKPAGEARMAVANSLASAAESNRETARILDHTLGTAKAIQEGLLKASPARS